MAIPKLIHYIWLQGAKNVPEKFRDNIQTTFNLNPDWKIYIWDENSIREELKKIGEQYLQKFDSFKILHQKVDFGRYAILYSLGGISVDIDAKAVKPFSQIPYINEKDFIVGYSSLNTAESLLQGYPKRIINNATILSSQYNPILKEVLDYIITLDCKPNQSDFSCVIFTTGQSLNEVVYKHKGEIVILDNSYFEACHSNDEYCELPANAIIEHKHEQTWVNPNQKRIAKIYYWLKHYWAIPVLGLLLLIFISGIFRREK